jgi:hypothetical protein
MVGRGLMQLFLLAFLKAERNLSLLICVLLNCVFLCRQYQPVWTGNHCRSRPANFAGLERWWLVDWFSLVTVISRTYRFDRPNPR